MSPGKSFTKEYLGDGLFVDFDGYQIVLTAEDGVRATNTVYLEPPVLEAFTNYVARLKATLGKRRPHLRLGEPTVVNVQSGEIIKKGTTYPTPDETETPYEKRPDETETPDFEKGRVGDDGKFEPEDKP